jgi:hypothetical protein
MRVTAGLTAFIAVVSLSVNSFAATVTATQGQVLINRGQGYQLVTTSVQASAGAIVIANPGGSAEVSYPDGCRVNVMPGAVVTIAPESPCKAQGRHVETGGSLKDGPSEVCCEEDHRKYLLGALGVVGVVGAVILLKENRPASP